MPNNNAWNLPRFILDNDDEYIKRMEAMQKAENEHREHLERCKRVDDDGTVEYFDTGNKVNIDDVNYTVHDINFRGEPMLYFENEPPKSEYLICEYTNEYYPRHDLVEVRDYGEVNIYSLRNSDDFFCCEDCGYWFHIDDEAQDGYCRACYDNREANIEDYFRDYSTDVVRSSKHGDIVKHLKVFGIELETVQAKGGNADNAINALEALPDGVGIHDDGSIDGKNGVEIVTQPLQGNAGEQLLEKVCKALNENKQTVNQSCGFHLHLSAPELLRSYPKLRALFAFYYAFDDVMLSFLPPSRSVNGYCKKLARVYSPDIVEAKSRPEFDRKLYCCSNNNQVRQCKTGGKYNNVRYSTLNVHSLYNNRRTIEIRSHSGTTDKEKILRWVQLHGIILDRVLNKVITKDNICDNITNILELPLDKKTEMFFNIIKLDTATKDFYLARQAKFKGMSPSTEVYEFDN